MFSRTYQKNHARQLVGLTLAVALLTSLFAVTSYSRTRSRSSSVAKTNGRTASPLIQPQTPALRANGKIAFVSTRDGNAEIYTMNPNGSNQTNITNNPADDYSPGWSPDGTKIFFLRYSDSDSKLYVMDADGSNQTNLTNNPANDFGFAWSPDRAKIAFSSNRDGNNEIYVMNADGSNQTRLTNDALADDSPQWFPDGARIIFVRYLTDQSGKSSGQIYVMNADGSNQTNLINSTSNDTQPAVSPDGTRIAFVRPASSLYNYNKSIYLMNANGSNQTMLTNGYYSSYSPHWSPDGTKIFFTRLDCYADVCGEGTVVMNADGSGQMVTIDPRLFSPDGTKVAYTSFEFVDYPIYGFSDISVANADGSNPRRITNSGNNEAPSWQPVSAPLPPLPNPIDEAEYFAQEHYRDFLNREPEPGGLAYWTDQITQCGNDAVCVHNRRIDVSAAFFLSVEFQQTGSFVYGLYKGALARQPNYPEFTADHNRVIGGPDLEAEKAALANDFVQRAEFLQHYPGSMTNTQFVNTLFDTAGLFPFTAERQAEIDAMNNQGRTRAQVLRNVIDIQAFKDREFNPSFVLMQYFGYMQRDIDQGGYEYWLVILNSTNNYRGMVCNFITSWEYQLRFGAVTRINADCSQ